MGVSGIDQSQFSPPRYVHNGGQKPQKITFDFGQQQLSQPIKFGQRAGFGHANNNERVVNFMGSADVFGGGPAGNYENGDNTPLIGQNQHNADLNQQRQPQLNLELQKVELEKTPQKDNEGHPDQAVGDKCVIF